MENNIFDKGFNKGDLLQHYVENFILTLKRDEVFMSVYNRKDGDKLLQMFLVIVLDHSIMKFLQMQELLHNESITVDQEAQIMSTQVHNHLLFFVENFGIGITHAHPKKFTKFIDKWHDFFLVGIKTMYNEMKNPNHE